MMGVLDVVCGPMFAGKSTELIRRYDRVVRAGRICLYVKPSMDTRKQMTHSGLVIPCSYVPDADKVLDLLAFITDPVGDRSADVSHLILDEVQFFAMDDPMPFVDAIQSYVDGSDITVTCGGLDTDQAGRPFATTAFLVGVADHVTKLTAICAECGEDAVRSSWSSPLEFGQDTRIGGEDRYKPTCRRHFEPVYEKHDPVGDGVADALRRRKFDPQDL